MRCHTLAVLHYLLTYPGCYPLNKEIVAYFRVTESYCVLLTSYILAHISMFNELGAFA